MKKIYILSTVLILLYPQYANAQITSIEEQRDVTQKLPVDNVNFRFIYRTSFCEDTVGKDRYFDNQALEIGNYSARYYSLFAEDMDSTMWKYRSGRLPSSGEGVNVKRNLKRNETGEYEDILIQFEAKEMTVSERFYKKDYEYREPLPSFKWTITGESSVILNYICQEALADFRGRTWRVWFAYDIPLPYGPWKLGGLPGLIVKAEDTSGLFTYELIGVEQPQTEKMYQYDMPKIKCKRSDIIRMNDMRWKNPEALAKMNGISAFSTYVQDPATGMIKKVNIFEGMRNVCIPQRELE